MISYKVGTDFIAEKHDNCAIIAKKGDRFIFLFKPDRSLVVRVGDNIVYADMVAVVARSARKVILGPVVIAGAGAAVDGVVMVRAGDGIAAAPALDPVDMAYIDPAQVDGVVAAGSGNDIIVSPAAVDDLDGVG